MTGIPKTTRAPERRGERLFTLRSGGGILLAAIAFSVVGVAWNLRGLWDPARERPRGDGRTVESYGFDLSTLLVPREAIVSSGMVADALPALVDPEAITPREVALMAEVERGKYLVPSDKIIGVAIGDESRAYPLRVLVWHEIVNDVVGGVPIAITYNPLSEGIAVFDRRVDGETLTFRVSGLLFNSGLLMYDDREAASEESLWSQLQARAISGPAAATGASLRLLPTALSRYDRWCERHPDTTVLAPLLGEVDKYRRDAYASYFNSDRLKYPVTPPPPDGTLPWKTRVVVTGPPGERRVVPLPVTDDQTRLEAVGPDDGAPVEGIYAFWFAWYATHPDDPGEIVRE